MPNRHPLWDCSGKIPHTSKPAAERHVSLSSKHGQRKWNVHAYRCAFCGYWHVGSMTISSKTPYKREHINLYAEIEQE